MSETNKKSLTIKIARQCWPGLLEPHYSDWVSAMTSEGLHHKDEIALVLAQQSEQIANLRNLVQELAEPVRERASEIYASSTISGKWWDDDDDRAEYERLVALLTRTDLQQPTADNNGT